MELCLSKDLDFCIPFYLGYFCIALWDSLSGLCALWDSLSIFPSLWLGRCTLGWPVWPVVGYPLLGVHPSISIVRLIVIGYHCNHLDGQLDYWASAHWLIGVTMMYWLCNQWLDHSTFLFRMDSLHRRIYSVNESTGPMVNNDIETLCEHGFCYILFLYLFLHGVKLLAMGLFQQWSSLAILWSLILWEPVLNWLCKCCSSL